MKKILVITLGIMFAVSSAFPANFSPTLLKINAPSQIQYKFDGTQLQIPVTVNGKPSNTIFMVYTKDKASSIGKITNGFLGWHFVNKIDTCLYWKSAGTLKVGNNVIQWDGKDTYGTKLPAGAYTYYLWGYDDQSPKESALRALSVQSLTYTESRDVKGMPLANPVLYIGLTKWPVGIDPSTASAQLERTTSGRPDIPRWGSTITLDPLDHSKFWQGEFGTKNLTLYATKYKYVPNGTSTVETSWGDNGSFTWATQPSGVGVTGALVGDEGDYLFMTYSNQSDTNANARVLYLNMDDGSQARILDISKYYCSKSDYEKGGQMNGGPSTINIRNGRLFTQGTFWCMTLAIDPYRDPGDEILWVNGNGDRVHDHHDGPNDPKAWMCNDFNVGPYTYTYSTDSNEFCDFPAYDLGAVTFGLIGPAGTGIGYFAVAGETAKTKNSARMLDEGSAYDGMYLDNASSLVTADNAGTWFLGWDSIKGVISSSVVVNEDAPAAFSVMQNTPNPFNPTTTINFTLAKAGKVTVDIYNAAGQKIDTVVNTSMKAGSHSVTWNASKFSAGVYFYTVKSGDFSKTMKMTLLR